MKEKLLYIIITILLTGCATGYKDINPTKLSYVAEESHEKGIKIFYKPDVLIKKYAKKERKKDVNVLAVKMINSSEEVLVLNDNLKITDITGNTLQLLDNNEIYKPLKQNVATYLLYLLLTPLNFYTSSTNQYGETQQDSSFPLGLILGPGITATNMIIASSANKRFKNDINTFNLKNKTIRPGDTLHGIIGIKKYQYGSLKLKIN